MYLCVSARILKYHTVNARVWMIWYLVRDFCS
jgi:hypothetical protein